MSALRGAAKPDDLANRFQAVRRFVQADRRAETALQFRVLAQRLASERLLDHHKAQAVQLLEDRPVLQPVRRVGVHHEGNVSEPPANPAHQLHIAPRCNLDFDSPIALGQESSDAIEQVIERRHQADGCSRFERAVLASKHRPQRPRLSLCVEVPDCAFDSGLRKRLAGKFRQAVPTPARVELRPIEETRR